MIANNPWVNRRRGKRKSASSQASPVTLTPTRRTVLNITNDNSYSINPIQLANSNNVGKLIEITAISKETGDYVNVFVLSRVEIRNSAVNSSISKRVFLHPVGATSGEDVVCISYTLDSEGNHSSIAINKMDKIDELKVAIIG